MMRCPFCNTDSEPSELSENPILGLTEETMYDEDKTYEFVCELMEFQCRDCGRSFYV